MVVKGDLRDATTRASEVQFYFILNIKISAKDHKAVFHQSRRDPNMVNASMANQESTEKRDGSFNSFT